MFLRIFIKIDIFNDIKIDIFNDIKTVLVNV